MNQKSFTKLKFPIHEIPQGTDLVHKFNELQEYPEFAKYPNADRNFVIRYVLYLYDRNSDLVKQYPDLTKRKEAAATLAGYERIEKTGLFKQNVIDMMELMVDDGGQSPLNDMIFCFLKLQNERLWTLIVINEEMFTEYTGLLMNPISGKDSKNILDAANVKSKLREEIKSISKDIDGFYKEMYGDNDELKEVKRKPINPETIHKTLKQ